MTHRQCVSTASASLLALLFDMPGMAADAPTPADKPAVAGAEPVQAIWKHQEIAFYFQSFTTFYSCTGLEGKLERIMRELGVHAKVRVRSADCPSSVARMPRVVMAVIGPVEASAMAARSVVARSAGPAAWRLRADRGIDQESVAEAGGAHRQ
jgi:hypothetical protein